MSLHFAGGHPEDDQFRAMLEKFAAEENERDRSDIADDLAHIAPALGMALLQAAEDWIATYQQTRGLNGSVYIRPQLMFQAAVQWMAARSNLGNG
jgi:hypothetical protein